MRALDDRSITRDDAEPIPFRCADRTRRAWIDLDNGVTMAPSELVDVSVVLVRGIDASRTGHQPQRELGVIGEPTLIEVR